jgi:hypothetical protein
MGYPISSIESDSFFNNHNKNNALVGLCMFIDK